MCFQDPVERASPTQYGDGLQGRGRLEISAPKRSEKLAAEGIQMVDPPPSDLSLDLDDEDEAAPKLLHPKRRRSLRLNPMTYDLELGE